VVSGVRNSCDASAANSLTLRSELSRAPKACWIRSSMVLMAAPSLPTSVWSSAVVILAVRSPRAVMSLAVLAILSSGPSPRPISHCPPIASSAISPPPVISSIRIRPRSCLVSTLDRSATMRTLAWRGVFSVDRISRAAAWRSSIGSAVGTGNQRPLLPSLMTSTGPMRLTARARARVATGDPDRVSGRTSNGRNVTWIAETPRVGRRAMSAGLRVLSARIVAWN
jgi:hypothetical protein